VLCFVLGIILLGGAFSEHEVFGVPLPPTFLGLISNLIATLVVLTVVGNMPFDLPSDCMKKEDTFLTTNDSRSSLLRRIIWSANSQDPL
jgi:hypothetical protein